MITDNVWIVILLVLGIVILANLAMFAAVRGSRGIKFDWLKGTNDSFSQPFNTENKSLRELHEKIDELSKQKQEGD